MLESPVFPSAAVAAPHHLGQTITIAMMVLFAGLGVFGMVAFIRNAIAVEPIKG